MATSKLNFNKPHAGGTLLLEVVGDDPAQVLDTFVELGKKLDGLEWVGKTSEPALPKAAKPVTKKEAKEKPELASQQMLDEALNLLSAAYADKTKRAATKALLAKYEVEKFGMIPVERAEELLADAKLITGTV